VEREGVISWALAPVLGVALAGLALAGLATEAWAREGAPPGEAMRAVGPRRTAIESPVRIAAPGDPLPRIECGVGYTATIYAEGLSSPDGLAFSPTGVLYVAEETAGRVRRVAPDGSLTIVLSGLQQPEGIAFDDSGSLYVVEDVEGGRVIKWTAEGGSSTLATGRDAPEGVVWAPDGTVYITESNVQFVGHFSNFRTHVTAISPAGGVTRILTNTIAWSYAGITIGPDGYLYVTNEFSSEVTNDSIFAVDPDSGVRRLFASELVVPEGLRFSVDGGFPLYVAEEGVATGSGRLSQVEADGSHSTFCTGFQHLEDVVLDKEGRLYVSEDPAGLVVRIERTVALSKAASPPDGSTVNPGEAITYTLSFTNSGSSDINGVVLYPRQRPHPPGIQHRSGPAAGAGVHRHAGGRGDVDGQLERDRLPGPVGHAADQPGGGRGGRAGPGDGQDDAPCGRVSQSGDRQEGDTGER
jgi:sugar lactone lactonase YvrE